MREVYYVINAAALKQIPAEQGGMPCDMFVAALNAEDIPMFKGYVEPLCSSCINDGWLTDATDSLSRNLVTSGESVTTVAFVR